MKTPMQELIDTFEEMRSPIDSKVDVDFAISLVKSMLEKEKEVIESVYEEGYGCGSLNGIYNESYYEETFNTKEK